eukprot:12417798-Karenia_brevis.AAC.1
MVAIVQPGRRAATGSHLTVVKPKGPPGGQGASGGEKGELTLLLHVWTGVGHRKTGSRRGGCMYV